MAKAPQRDKFKPFRAALPDREYSQIQFPCYGSPKIDGIRGLTAAPNHGTTTLMSKQMKPLPNEFIRDTLSNFPYLDGELTIGCHHDPQTYDRAKSRVMTIKGQPDFTYWVFDTTYDYDAPKSARLAMLYRNLVGKFPFIKVVPHFLLRDRQDFEEFLDHTLYMGFEGVMTVTPESGYKWGQATVKENSMFKVKPYVDDDAVIVGFVEKMINGNEPTIDAMGYQRRSSHQDGLIPAGTLGAVVCRSEKFTETFQMGSGFDADLAAEIWNNRDKYMGAPVEYKFQDHGTKDRPRQPIFLRFKAKGT